jgi:hypothetical protein
MPFGYRVCHNSIPLLVMPMQQERLLLSGVKSVRPPHSAKVFCLAPQADREWQQNWEFPLAAESNPASINFSLL